MTSAPGPFVAWWGSLGGADGEAVHAALVDRYGDSRRAYHDLRHVEECLAWLDAAAHLVERPAEAAVALWFHDAVQGTADDVGDSVAWFDAMADPMDPAARARIAALIEATRHGRAPLEGDARVVADVDLAILGSAPRRFERYELDVRREHPNVPEEAFREARARILRDLLERLRIYRTDWFATRLEAQARDNLARSLARLG